MERDCIAVLSIGSCFLFYLTFPSTCPFHPNPPLHLKSPPHSTVRLRP